MFVCRISTIHCKCIQYYFFDETVLFSYVDSENLNQCQDQQQLIKHNISINTIVNYVHFGEYFVLICLTWSDIIVLKLS